MPCARHSSLRFWPAIVLMVWAMASSGRAEVQILTQPQNRLNVAPGTAATFTVTAEGIPPLRYQWRLNGVNISGATQSSYTASPVVPKSAGTYSVAVGDVDGYESSAPALLTLGIPPTANVGLFANSTELLGLVGILRTDNFTAIKEVGEPLHAGKRGGKSVWFRWTVPLQLVEGIATLTTEGSSFDTLLAVYSGSTLSTLQLVAANDDERDGFLTSKVQFNVPAGLMQTFYIAVDGFSGASGEIVLAWNLEPAEDSLPQITMSPSRTVAPGERVELFFSSTKGEFEWYLNDQPTGVRESPFVIEQAREEHVGWYSVRVQTLTRTIVTAPLNLQIHFREDGTSDPESASFTKFLESSDQIHEIVPNLVTLAGGGSSSGYSSTQIFSTHGSVKEVGEPNHCGEAGGASEWYAYQAPENGMLHINTDGSNYDTVLAVYTGPGTDFASLIEVDCDSTPASNGGDRVRFGAQQDTIYFIAVDGVNGAKGMVKLNINLGEPVQILTPPMSQATAPGSNVTFTVEAAGSGTLTYQWLFNGAPIPGATTWAYTITDAADPHVGNYTVVVSNLVNVVTSSPPASLSFIVPPTVSIHPASQTVPPGSSVPLTVVATANPEPEYQWLFGGAELAGKTQPVLTLSDFQGGDEGEYQVRVTNPGGMALSDVAVLMLDFPPRIGSFALEAGCFEVQFIGPANTSFLIEGSANLQDWLPLLTNYSANGFIFFNDTNPPSPSRFYRARELP